VRFDAGEAEGGEGAVDVIESISIAFHGSGGLLPGAPAQIYLWDDPNNDGNPADAVLLASRDVVVEVVNDFYATAPVVFSAYAIDPVLVSGSFFVGVSAAGDTFPALLDLTVPRAERSFFVGLPGGDATDAFRTASPISSDCMGGTFMIRANVNDVDNDGVPDDCGGAPTGDLNGDGIVDGADLGILLAAWGACPMRGACIADLYGDGAVDGADLGILLANWTVIRR